MLLPLLVALLVLVGGVIGGILANRHAATPETAGTRALRARLPADVFGDCSPARAAGGATAALTCTGQDPRVDHLEVVQVPDAGTLATRFAALSADRALVNRRCAGETRNSAAFWTRNGTRQGAFACFTDPSGRRRLLWQYDAGGVEVQAVGKDGSPATAQDLYTWWSSEARDRPLAG